MTNAKVIGDTLAKLRERSGFKSQRQLAMEAGISPATLSRIEAGTQKPQPETLKTLSKYLRDTSYEDLMKMAGYIEEEALIATEEVDEYARELKELFADDPESSSFWYEFKESSPEDRKRMIEVWRLINSKEKGRTPGDKQGT
ncbi:MAG TPA: helix-turn-helix transcriptional regulator [Bacilli bacterium]|nr:helix-turn-helix transcriptional regulator [Bacilli bacterium]